MLLTLPTPDEVLRVREGTLPAVCGVRGGGAFILRSRKGEVKQKGRWKNAATTVGRNFMLNSMFRNGSVTVSANWYCGLVNNSGFSAFAATDTMSSHSGWTEVDAYSDATRRQWSPGAASGSLLSAAVTVFNIDGTFAIYGVFIVDNNTISGTGGTLWATGAFDAVVEAVNLDTLTVTYEAELQANS